MQITTPYSLLLVTQQNCLYTIVYIMSPVNSINTTKQLQHQDESSLNARELLHF